MIVKFVISYRRLSGPRAPHIFGQVYASVYIIFSSKQLLGCFTVYTDIVAFDLIDREVHVCFSEGGSFN